MKNLKAYIKNYNSWNAIFNGKKYSFPLSQEDVSNIVNDIDGNLSPENLCCDGEISPAAARKKARQLIGAYIDIQAYAAKNGYILPKTWCVEDYL